MHKATGSHKIQRSRSAIRISCSHRNRPLRSSRAALGSVHVVRTVIATATIAAQSYQRTLAREDSLNALVGDLFCFD